MKNSIPSALRVIENSHKRHTHNHSQTHACERNCNLARVKEKAAFEYQILSAWFSNAEHMFFVKVKVNNRSILFICKSRRKCEHNHNNRNVDNKHRHNLMYTVYR